MTYTSLALTDPVSSASVTLLPAAGCKVQVLDVTTPARGVAEDRVAGHGSYDSTVFLGPAAVSLSLMLYPEGSQTPEKFWDALAPLLNPALRPVLVAGNDQWAANRQLVVRYESASKPFSDVTQWPVQISWTAPAGAWENAASSSVTFAAGATDVYHGLTAGGNTPCQWQARLYGPCTGPRLAVQSGQAVDFTDDLTLTAGQYMLVDSAARDAWLYDDPAQPVISYLDYTTSQWWLLQPSDLTLAQYCPSYWVAGAQASVIWRPAWVA